jgi:hypothetical protein
MALSEYNYQIEYSHGKSNLLDDALRRLVAIETENIILLMKSRGHSTSSVVEKGNFCTKFSNTGTILREVAHTIIVHTAVLNRSEYKKGTATPLISI